MSVLITKFYFKDKPNEITPFDVCSRFVLSPKRVVRETPKKYPKRLFSLRVF